MGRGQTGLPPPLGGAPPFHKGGLPPVGPLIKGRTVRGTVRMRLGEASSSKAPPEGRWGFTPGLRPLKGAHSGKSVQIPAAPPDQSSGWRPGARPLPAGAQVDLSHVTEVRPGQGHVDQPHRVATVVRVRTGHAGEWTGPGRQPSTCAGAPGPWPGPPGGLTAPYWSSRSWGTPSTPCLDLVGVAHHAALEHGGGAGQVGDAAWPPGPRCRTRRCPGSGPGPSSRAQRGLLQAVATSAP